MKHSYRWLGLVLSALLLLGGCSRDPAGPKDPNEPAGPAEPGQADGSGGEARSLAEQILGRQESDALLLIVHNPEEDDLAAAADTDELTVDQGGETVLIAAALPASSLRVERLRWADGVYFIDEVLFEEPATERDFALVMTCARPDDIPLIKITVEHGGDIAEYLFGDAGRGGQRKVEAVPPGTLNGSGKFLAGEIEQVFSLDEAGLNALFGEQKSVIEKPGSALEIYYNGAVVHATKDEEEGFSLYYLEVSTSALTGPRGTKVGDRAQDVVNAYYGTERELQPLGGSGDLQYSLLYGEMLGAQSYGIVRYTNGLRSGIQYADGLSLIYYAIDEGRVSAIHFSRAEPEAPAA